MIKPKTLHLVSAVTDEVHSFLGPATRELSQIGQPQNIVLIDDAGTRNNIRQLEEHAELVKISESSNIYVRYKNFFKVCCEEIIRCRPDTLHLHGIIPCILGTLALQKCRHKAKILYSPHGSRSLSTLRMAGWLTLIAARPLIRPSKISAIATFPLETKSLESWGSMQLVESPVHEIYFNCRKEETPKPLVLSGGTDAKKQTVDILSQLAVLLSAEELEINFKWLGNVEPATARCFNAAGVQIVDIGKRAVHASELSKGWLYVAPWWTRGYPLFLIQAMAAGLPSVVLDCPQHRHVVEHGKTGFLCSSEDEMVAAIAMLIDMPKMREQMGAAARASALARFGEAEFRSKLLDSYSKPYLLN